MGRMRAGADPRAALTPPRRAFEFQAPKQAVCPASEAARKTGLRLDGIVVARSKATRRSRSRRGRPTFPWIASLRFARNDARSNRLTPRPPALRLVLRAARSTVSRRTLQKEPTGAFFEAPLYAGRLRMRVAPTAYAPAARRTPSSTAASASWVFAPSGPPACAMSGRPPPPLPPSAAEPRRTRSTALKRLVRSGV